MTLKHIRERVQNGFRPFQIITTSGRRHLMPHPEFIMIGKNVVAVMASNEVVHTIDALHITAVEDLPAKKRR